jgi:hypothetical protein
MRRQTHSESAQSHGDPEPPQTCLHEDAQLPFPMRSFDMLQYRSPPNRSLEKTAKMHALTSFRGEFPAFTEKARLQDSFVPTGLTRRVYPYQSKVR